MFQPYLVGGASNLAEYLTQGLGRDDYYLTGYEPPGILYGKGCQDLGITEGQLVTKEVFVNLGEGFSPDGKVRLVQNAGSANRQKLWDGVFSASKDVSIAYARASPAEQAEIQARALTQLKLILDNFEENYITSRVGKAGEEQVKGRLVCAIFPHLTSRAQDAQLHYHCTFFNVCTRERGNGILDSGTIQSKALYTKQRLLGSQFQTAMYQVMESMGLLSEGHGKDTRLQGISKELCEAHSKRHEQIEKEIQRTGATTAREKEEIQRRTRKAKSRVPQEELFGRWHEEFDEAGLTEKAFAALHREPPRRDKAEELEGALERAAKHLTNRQSYFNEARFGEEVFLEARGRGLDTTTLLAGIQKRLSSTQHMAFLAEIEGEKLFTTTEMLALERSYFGHLRAARGASAHQVSLDHVQEAICELELAETKAKGETVSLSAEQREAVHRMCRGEDAICVLTGDAGTGKSFACKAARRAFELEGFRCIGATIAKKAALGLEESTGIKSTSIAKLIGSEELDFRGDLEMGLLDHVSNAATGVVWAGMKSVKQDLQRDCLGRFLVKRTPVGTALESVLPPRSNPVTVNERTVLFVDEAAQLSTRDMEKLIRLVREQGGKI
jgi:conjugative relaxase-like TrwC/TraI family protein